MKYLLLTLLIISVSACATPNPVLIAERPEVFIPDDQFFYCPTIKNFPDPLTLTDGEIAKLLIVLDTNNRICAGSIRELRNQLIAAQATLENR